MLAEASPGNEYGTTTIDRNEKSAAVTGAGTEDSTGSTTIGIFMPMRNAGSSTDPERPVSSEKSDNEQDDRPSAHAGATRLLLTEGQPSSDPSDGPATEPAADAAASAPGQAVHDRTMTVPDRTMTVTMVMAAGVLLVSVAYTVGRSGHPGTGTALLWPGLIMVFASAAFRLLRRGTGPRERLRVSVLLGVALYFCFELTQISAVREFDELLHMRTLLDLQATGHLFTAHPGLPISPRFPGLELLTNSVVQLFGVPNQVAVIAVVLLARALFVYGLFLLIERLTRSAYAAGVGTAIYSCSPQFYFFNAQFAYQSLAIALTVLLLVSIVDRPRYGRVTAGVLIAMTWIAITLTHHATSWIIVGLVALWALCAFARRDRPDGKALAAIAMVGLATAAGWALVNVSMLRDYLGPILSDSLHQASGVATGETKSRKMFSDSGGTVTPPWEVIALLGSTLLWMMSLLPLPPFRFRPAADGRRASLYRVLRLMHLAFPLTVIGTVAPRTAELSTRMSTFIYLGLAAVLGLTITTFIATRRRYLVQITAGLAVFVFVGGTVLGSGGDWSRMPGPYMVIADGRSIDPYVVAATNWVNTNLPADSRLAADRETGVRLVGIGRKWVVSALGSGTSAGPLYFAATIGDYERRVITDGRIDYVIVDTRLADGLPHETFYVENGEAPVGSQLTRAELAKFDSTPGSVKVYDNGPVKIYNLKGLWLPGSPSRPEESSR
ncbi:glycosyltransferase [Frankia sp. Cppng1_Ct_nod]|uniref:glycosyltransferase n=1 Tax=Frankia sp. Cppng1_Ct_nod TaxID=2897162 RepID=UPI001041358B|nr:glycosyltransferase [Frankia sp. Cppng1_Ct_nod]